ncbi:MAG: hypothetical protein JWL77_6498 [Chthonomonadaceae bacterium]|nr:hypothetical protein [Chthonomonadaceae bacterium]
MNWMTMPYGQSWLIFSGLGQGLLQGKLVSWMLHVNKGGFVAITLLRMCAGPLLGNLEWHLFLSFTERKPRKKRRF